MKKTILFFAALLSTLHLSAQFVPSGLQQGEIVHLSGQVGIGEPDPNALLDIFMDPNFLIGHESGLRITYKPPASLPTLPIVNESIFHIRAESPFNTATSSRFVVKRNGNVGIGIEHTNPLLNDQRLVVTDGNRQKIDLHVMGFNLVDGENASLLLGAQTGAPYGEWGIEYNEFAATKGLNFWKPFGSNNYGNYFMFLTDRGKVSIGLDPNDPTTYNGNYKLYVADGIMTEKVKVAIKNTAEWADYVFERDYELMPLHELDQFISVHGHLPNVPSAEEVVEQGIDMAKMDAKLLEKIEELNLYMIEMHKENEALRDAVEALQSDLNSINK